MALVNLPGYAPGNALNFSPISDAIDSNRQNALAQQQLGMQKERMGLERERFGMEKQQFDQKQQMATVQRFAGIAQGIDQMTDPAQRTAAWQNLIKQHPNGAQLPEIYRDPIRGPKLLMQEAQGFVDPLDKQAKEAQIGMHGAHSELYRAQAEKARREAATGGELYGKDIKVFQGPDGKIYGVQAGSRDELKYHDLSAPGGGGVGTMPAGPGGAPPNALAPQGAPAPRQPLTPFQKRSVVGDRVFNPGTGQFEGSAAEALEGGEIAKGRGDALVKLETTLPKARAALEAANVKSDLVRSKIAQALPMVSNWTTGYGSVLANWPATAARDFKGITDTIIANLGFDELQEMRTNSPTGGALGAIAVQELEMLTRTKASLEQAQTPQQVIRALQELDSFYQQAGPRRQRAFEETYAPLNRRTGNSPVVTGPSVPRQFNDRLPPSGGPAPGVQGMIPPQAVQFLRGNPSPEIIQQFEAKYGPGSARQFMQGQ